MRQLKLLAVFALLGFTFLSACSSPSSSPASPTYSMKATIGSTTMNATSCIAALVGTNLGITGSTVTGSVGGPPQINISIYGWSGAAGTTSLIAPGSTGAFAEYVPTVGALTSVSQSGSVTISAVSSTTISGTFNFTCSDGKVITAGTFTAKRY